MELTEARRKKIEKWFNRPSYKRGTAAMLVLRDLSNGVPRNFNALFDGNRYAFELNLKRMKLELARLDVAVNVNKEDLEKLKNDLEYRELEERLAKERARFYQEEPETIEQMITKKEKHVESLEIMISCLKELQEEFVSEGKEVHRDELIKRFQAKYDSKIPDNKEYCYLPHQSLIGMTKLLDQLRMDGSIEKISRGMYQITEQGKQTYERMK